MIEKWELLELWDITITIYSANKYTRIKTEDVLENEGKNRFDYHEVIPIILAQGWEPFSAIGGRHIFFRRKLKI